MHYKIEVIVNSERTEDDVALYAEGVLTGHFDVEDLSVYAINR